MGTIIIPALLVVFGTGLIFGWAKPVPVNFSRLGTPRRDMILVAAAGPIVNILLACISVLVLAFIHNNTLNPFVLALYISINIMGPLALAVPARSYVRAFDLPAAALPAMSPWP